MNHPFWGTNIFGNTPISFHPPPRDQSPAGSIAHHDQHSPDIDRIHLRDDSCLSWLETINIKTTSPHMVDVLMVSQSRIEIWIQKITPKTKAIPSLG